MKDETQPDSQMSMFTDHGERKYLSLSECRRFEKAIACLSDPDLPQEGGPPVKLEIDGYDRPVVATGA